MDFFDLPMRWRNKIVLWLQEKGIGDRTELKERDFDTTKLVEIELADGSKATFHDILVIKAPEYQEIGVFTKTAGYHVFPIEGTTYEIKDK